MLQWTNDFFNLPAYINRTIFWFGEEEICLKTNKKEKISSTSMLESYAYIYIGIIYANKGWLTDINIDLKMCEELTVINFYLQILYHANTFGEAVEHHWMCINMQNSSWLLYHIRSLCVAVSGLVILLFRIRTASLYLWNIVQCQSGSNTTPLETLRIIMVLRIIWILLL